ncbi:MAG TPA: gamma-glutamyltransferase, partial [Zunongwangia profunda]|nr:gamma-glutamyltransferase [Zunongwangia profunda]
MKKIYTPLFLIIVCFAPLFSTFAQSGRIPVSSEKGIVTSSHKLASQAGAQILSDGGNAVDASIATAFALAVTLPSAGNIGGGGFLVYRGEDGTETTFNFREKAPLAATETMYLGEDGKVKDNSNHDGLLAVGVPGTVAGLYKAHQKFGKLDWKDLLKPALKLAKKGYPVSEDMQWFFKWVKEHKDDYASTAEIFLKEDGSLYKNGEILVQKDLYKTLKRIQKHGPDGFYKGKTAELLADFMAKNGGIITEEDLARYEAEEMKPIKG